ncbi:MAG: ATP-binding protein [Candidatus Delongbacteria bacterium]|nr:ATP-binding protein [Candidatus Delongbacteria bacterium]MBN2836269.1 ATP-binding protein [Candidatus Delongbacteria bacterium]
MLLDFGVKNFYSFHEGFELSLRLNRKCPISVSKGKKYANVICINGANASGKTNVLKALNFISQFVSNSFSLKPEEELGFEPFFNSKEDSDFFVTFMINDIEYRYELSANPTRVLSEIVYRKDKRYVKVIEREERNFVYLHPDFSDLEIIKLRNNASLISTAKQYELVSTNLIYSFFYNFISNVNRFGLFKNVPSISFISEIYHNKKSYFDFVKEQIKSFDVGISNIEILSREDENGKQIYFPIFVHDLDDSEEGLTIYTESSGTRALYEILYLYKLALEHGSILILDEFDINLHPFILPKLIELFESNLNEKGAQLIFTTHNFTVMNELGKYKVALVNKKKNSSYVYRLDEIPGDIVRNDREISRVYYSGKIGGTPKI